MYDINMVNLNGKENDMKINEVAKLTGITVRTLHYYDEIGLLNPSEHTESNYRIYSRNDIERLQQILFFKELDFPLSKIKSFLSSKNYDKTFALAKQKELLVEKRNRLNGLITLLDEILKGENEMSFKEFDNSKSEKMKEDYVKEVKERFGGTKHYTEFEEKSINYTKKDYAELAKKSESIFEEFSAIKSENPASEKAQELVLKWQNFITKHYYKCDKTILLGLSEMYVSDERFKENIDKSGAGTAEFMTNAIKHFCR